LHQQKAVPEISVAVLGCNAPDMDRGVTGEDGWTGKFPGTICQIVLQHPKINGGLGFVYEPSVSRIFSENRQFTFEYQQPDKQAASELNIELALEKGELIWNRSGRSKHYARN